MLRSRLWIPILIVLAILIFPRILAAQTQQSCVILKRMGPADQVTSHLYSFGIRGKQFQYVEGEVPKGVKFHGRLTDNDVRKIQEAGGRVAVVESHYTDQDLAQARKACSTPGSESSASTDSPTTESKPKERVADAVSQPAAAAEPTNPASQPPPAAAPTPAAAPPAQPVSSEDLTTAVLKTDPPGADVTVDGKYMGSTPSTVRLAPGDHTILFEKAGFKPWQRTMTVNPGGIVTIDAALTKAP